MLTKHLQWLQKHLPFVDALLRVSTSHAGLDDLSLLFAVHVVVKRAQALERRLLSDCAHIETFEHNFCGSRKAAHAPVRDEQRSGIFVVLLGIAFVLLFVEL